MGVIVLFIMLGILYKNKKLYGYRIVNYIENQKQHEVKDCSVEQVRLAFSRGAKIDNLAIKNNRILITKGIKTDYERIEEGIKDERLSSGYRFAYVVPANNERKFTLVQTNGSNVDDSVLEYEIYTLMNYFVIPNICDAYTRYIGEQLAILTPKGTLDTTLFNNGQITCTDYIQNRLRSENTNLECYIDKSIKHIGNSSVPLIGNYIVGSLTFRVDSSSISDYRGLSDFIDSEARDKLAYKKIKINYDGNIFKKAVSRPEDMENYKQLEEYFKYNKNSEFYLTYNDKVNTLVYRKIGNNGIVYKARKSNEIYTLTIEQVYYNIVNNIETYQNVMLEGNSLIVYGLDGVMRYDMDKIHEEYKGKIKESQNGINNRLLGKNHIEHVNDRHELLKLETDSENVIIGDDIVRVNPYAVQVSAAYHKTLVIGKNVVYCSNGIVISPTHEDRTIDEFRIVIRCAITKSLLSGFIQYLGNMDLDNRVIDSQIILNVPTVVYTHNYRIKVSELQKLVSNTYSSEEINKSIRYLLKVSKLNISKIKRLNSNNENLIHIK